MIGVCCLLRVDCWLVIVARAMFVARCLSFVVGCMLCELFPFVVRCISFVMCCLFVVCRSSMRVCCLVCDVC